MTIFRTLSIALLVVASAAAHAAGFDVTDTQGRRHRLADYQGRWVIVNFWATWCVPCIQEIPEIAAFARTHPNVVVIGVATDSEDPAKVKRFAAKVGHAYPLVLSDDRVEKQLGHPYALPTTRIFDPRGKIAYDRAGRVDGKLLEQVTGGPSPRPSPKGEGERHSAQRSFSTLKTRFG